MKKKQYITKNTLMGEIVEKYPQLIEVLTTDYGFHCFGCFAANMETLGEGAQVHGMGSKEIKELLETLNSLLEEEKAKKKGNNRGNNKIDKIGTAQREKKKNG